MIRKSKYNVNTSKAGIEKRTVNGITFDSDAEAKYFKEVVLTDPTITDYKLHPKYMLQDKFEKYGRKFHPIYYEADFEIHRGLEITVVDVKGMPTETALLKRKLFDKRYHDLILEWVAYSKIDGGWIDLDKLKKARKERKKTKEEAAKAKLII